TPVSAKNLGLNPLSIIPNAETKILFVVANFNFYVSRCRVSEGITQRLCRKPPITPGNGGLVVYVPGAVALGAPVWAEPRLDDTVAAIRIGAPHRGSVLYKIGICVGLLCSTVFSSR